MTVLETKRLMLRHLSPDDAPFILELLNQPSFLRFIGDKNVRSREDAVRYLETGPLASYERFGFGLYRVGLKDTGTPIGMCGLLKRDTLPDADIGFAFLPDYWSAGYAFEAAEAVMNYGRGLGLKRIVAITSFDNEASIKLLGKIGMQFEGVIKLADDQPEVKLFGKSLAA